MQAFKYVMLSSFRIVEYATILLSGAVLTFGNSLFNKVMV
jgi:hypothetical protein